MTFTGFRNADGKNETPVSLAAPLPTLHMPESMLSTVTAATVSAAGTGYVPADTVTLAGGDYAIAPVVTVTHTKAITAAVVAGGTGGSPGAVTITGTTGTGTKFQATGTITAGGVLSGPLVVTVAGDYTVNPTDITAEPVTGGSLSGATVLLTLGIKTVSVTTAGIYLVVPSPATQAVTSGVGAGATFTLTTTALTSSLGSVGIDQTTDGTTNLVAAKQSGTWIVGHGKTIKSVSGTLTADTDVITAVTSKRIKVIAYSIFTTGVSANARIFKSNGTSGTELWRVILQAPAASSVYGANLAIAAPSFLFATVAGEKLTLDVGDTDTIHYSITYFDDDAT